MKSIYSKKLIPVYLLLSLGLTYIFGRIDCIYLTGTPATPHPIDVHFFKIQKFFDVAYYIEAKQNGYNHAGYFKSFFLVDLFYPAVYSLLFLSIVQLFKKETYYKGFFILILAGCIFDYLENFSFSLFLTQEGNDLAGMVNFFSSVKSILSLLNMAVAVTGLLAIVMQLFYRPGSEL